jgi:frataxin-like iron-binding protein CyaY
LVERVRKIDERAARYMIGKRREPLPGEDRTEPFLTCWCTWKQTRDGHRFWQNIEDKLSTPDKPNTKKLTGDQIAKNILAVARWDKSGALMINSQECAKAIRHLQAKVRKLEKESK